MKIRRTALCRATQLALLAVLAGMGSVANLWAQNQCSGALPVGNATGCGALITVIAVSEGTATAYTVTTLGNGNPYDADDDTLVGIINNSGASLNSITLSSPDTTFGGLFGFDADGPCGYNGHVADCFGGAEAGVDPGDYQGPNNTFTVATGTPCAYITGTCYLSGTVNFTGDGIPNGGSTWFALEGTPTSLQISQTKTLNPPGTFTEYDFGTSGTDNVKIEGLNNEGGESVTLTAFLVAKASFVPPLNGPGSNESCIPYGDFSGTTDTCVEVQLSCTIGSASSNDCSTLFYQIWTNYGLPTDFPVTSIVGPDFLFFGGQNCPTTVASTAESIFQSFGVNTIDPVTRGGTNPINGCFVATYTPGATNLITSGTTSRFSGWESPVVDTDLNMVKAGSTVPLKFDWNNILGNPITNLSYCNAFTTNLLTGANVCNDTPTVSTPWVNLTYFFINCQTDVPVSTDTDISAPGNSGFQNLGDGNYKMNWQTQKGWKGSCANVIATFDNGVWFVPATLGFQFN